MYNIVNFDRNSGNMIFMINNNIKKSINVLKYNDYRKVAHNHYYDKNNDSIILINNPRLSPVLIDSDGSIYTKTSQYMFDKWMAREYPNSHNSIVYNFLTSN